MHFIHAYIYFFKFTKEIFFKVDRNKISFVKENRDKPFLFLLNKHMYSFKIYVSSLIILFMYNVITSVAFLFIILKIKMTSELFELVV
jgi:hypothetical protein